MIRICVQAEIRGPRDAVWEKLMGQFPPEYRRPGKVDLAELRAASGDAHPADAPSTPKPEMEILDWDEGRAFLIRVSQKPYLQNLLVDGSLEDTGGWEGDTLVNLRLKIRAGCLLDLPVKLLYWLFRDSINRRIVEGLAAIRYEIETGRPLDKDSPIKPPLDRIEIVRCP